MTGLNVWISVFSVGVVCTFYTTLVSFTSSSSLCTRITLIFKKHKAEFCRKRFLYFDGKFGQALLHICFRSGLTVLGFGMVQHFLTLFRKMKMFQTKSPSILQCPAGHPHLWCVTCCLYVWVWLWWVLLQGVTSILQCGLTVQALSKYAFVKIGLYSKYSQNHISISVLFFPLNLKFIDLKEVYSVLLFRARCTCMF